MIEEEMIRRGSEEGKWRWWAGGNYNCDLDVFALAWLQFSQEIPVWNGI